MRKITEQACRAFQNGKNFKLQNTQVINDGVTVSMYLHGHKIACRELSTNNMQICLCGYNTVTTRERLNGLSGVNLRSKNFTPYLNGAEISCYDWVQI
jgi:hypothetical protein